MGYVDRDHHQGRVRLSFLFLSSASCERRTDPFDPLPPSSRNQIYLPSSLVVQASYSLPHTTLWYGSILANETDPYFQQLNESATCLAGCTRTLPAGSRVSQCTPTHEWKDAWSKREGRWEAQLMSSKGAVADEWYGHGAHGPPHSHDEL